MPRLKGVIVHWVGSKTIAFLGRDPAERDAGNAIILVFTRRVLFLTLGFIVSRTAKPSISRYRAETRF